MSSEQKVCMRMRELFDGRRIEDLNFARKNLCILYH